MRHRCGNAKLSKSTEDRMAMLRSLMQALFQRGKIKTTQARAKAAREECEECEQGGEDEQLRNLEHAHLHAQALDYPHQHGGKQAEDEQNGGP